MARILRRILTAFGDLYSADADKSAPEFVELSGSIAPVHDVSRRVEMESFALSAVGRGYFNLTIPTTHAAADTQTASKNVYNELATISPVAISKLDVWLLDYGIVSPNATILTSGAALALILPSDFPTLGTPAEGIPLGLNVTTAGTIFFDGGAGTFGAQRTGVVNDVRQNGQIPLFLPRGSVLTTRVTSSAAGTFDSWFRLWAGFVGTRPPGVA